ncbi:hypothetical protein BY457_10510 [Marinilabilia salmonicolor]|nr:hypothetical protein BY457_10510 [Marinilabilia salmonicolor]
MKIVEIITGYLHPKLKIFIFVEETNEEDFL